MVLFEIGLVSLRSVGTAGTLAAAGFYLHQRGFVTAEGKQAFGRYIQQVGLPFLFFSKLVECPTSSSSSSSSWNSHEDNNNSTVCASVLDYWEEAWILLVWPFFVIGCGLVLGFFAAWLSRSPRSHYGHVMFAVAFNNYNSLPTALLSVLFQQQHHHANTQQQLPHLQDASVLDPNSFLSVYLVFFPVIFWSFGMWLVKPPSSSSTDKAVAPLEDSQQDSNVVSLLVPSSNLMTTTTHESVEASMDHHHHAEHGEHVGLLSGKPTTTTTTTMMTTSTTAIAAAAGDSSLSWLSPPQWATTVLETMGQPPVLGVLGGLLVTAVDPVRRLLVGPHGAPLDWFMTGISTIGEAAIPVSMAVLGMNLSKVVERGWQEHQQQKKTKQRQGQVLASSSNEQADNGQNHHDLQHQLFHRSTVFAIVLAKMVVMPLIGVASFLCVRNVGDFRWVPSMSVVLLMEWITPTANDSVVLADVAGGMSEALAQVLAWQYLFAPVLLSISVGVTVYFSGLST